MELPLLNRNEGPIAEALAKREEAAARFLAVQASVVAEIDRAAQGHAAVHDQLKNTEAVLEAQRRQAETIQASFQAGGADRFEADSARLEAAVAELAVLDARTRAAHALGQLEDALQIPFDALQSVDKNPHSPPSQEKP
jgi:outer membrane protein TolC